MGISKQMQMEELDRIKREEYDPKRKFDNDELVEVIENLQKESKLTNMSGIPDNSYEGSAEEEEMKKFPEIRKVKTDE